MTPGREQLVPMANAAAIAHEVDPALLCALVEQESAWNVYAIRYEPAFYARYIAGMVGRISPTEAQSRAFSWGLCQLMGNTARQLGYGGTFLASVLDPVINLDLGAKLLRQLLDAAKGDATAALLKYNGGGNLKYPDMVLARVRNYPGDPSSPVSPTGISA